MRSRANGVIGNWDAANLAPIIARAVELGRGPHGLMGWIRGQMEPPGGCELEARGPTVGRLAEELARILGPRVAAETIVGLWEESHRVGGRP